MTSDIRPLRLLVKALCLFVIVNVIYALIDPRVPVASGYNVLFPGRARLPFGAADDPYTVTVEGVDAMFASHAIAAPKRADEYRVALIGDSSIWGEDMSPEEMISTQWNALNVQCGGKTVRAYNLGYPHPSILKDLVILDKAVEYHPDLIVWFVTLNTLASQRVNPFLAANQERVLSMVETYDIPFELSDVLRKYEPDFYKKTIVGQRSNLARQIKLQVLGIIWAATGADRDPLSLHDEIPDYEVSDDPRYHSMRPPDDIKETLLFSALAAGYDMAGDVPVLIVNEPIYLTSEDRSTVRYNSVYPRWAYDQYRKYMAEQSDAAGWNYLDLWDAIPPEYFSDASLHLSSAGERLLVEQIDPAVQSLCTAKP
ncbi:MAG TPA: hypothetical protein VKP08_15640 [Anaerolineales bacterium]|nr:hypothetical protein [Anaerolineales bacterium]